MGPTFAASPTSQPLSDAALTEVSQKNGRGYWTVTVRPSTQAGVVAPETGRCSPGDPAKAEPAMTPTASDAAATEPTTRGARCRSVR